MVATCDTHPKGGTQSRGVREDQGSSGPEGPRRTVWGLAGRRGRHTPPRAVWRGRHPGLGEVLSCIRSGLRLHTALPPTWATRDPPQLQSSGTCRDGHGCILSCKVKGPLQVGEEPSDTSLYLLGHPWSGTCPAAGLVTAASSRCRAGVRAGQALRSLHGGQWMEGTRSCGHDVTTSTLRGPAGSGRTRQSTGNRGVRDWMWSPPECWGQGWARGGRGSSLLGNQWGDAGWGDPIRAAPRGTNGCVVRWRCTPQPSAADKLQLHPRPHAQLPRPSSMCGQGQRSAGEVGLRALGDLSHRVRLEPMSAARFFPGPRVLSADGIWWQEHSQWWREPEVGTQKVRGAPLRPPQEKRP